MLFSFAVTAQLSKVYLWLSKVCVAAFTYDNHKEYKQSYLYTPQYIKYIEIYITSRPRADFTKTSHSSIIYS